MTKDPNAFTRRNIASLINGAGKKLAFQCKRLKLDPYLSPCIKVKLEWIKYLHIKTKHNLLENKAGGTLKDISIGKDFVNKIAIAQEVLQRTNIWDIIKETLNSQKLLTE